MTEVNQVSPPVNLLKYCLKSGEPSCVFAVRSTHHAGIVSLAQAAGYQGLYIDFQHSAIGLAEAANIFQAGLHAGLTVLSRIPTMDTALIGRIIDSGGQGVMLADVRSPEQSRQFVNAALLHPLGERSLGMPTDPRFRGLSGPALMAAINESTLLIAMVESEQGINKIFEIASTPGIDAVQIGTSDLTAAMGIPGEFAHPRVRIAYEKVAAACRACNKPFIIGGVRKPDELKPLLALGAAKCYFTGSDTSFLLEGARIAKDRAALVVNA
jgi:2-keto-3-deoxy-L-rhamnonate aldolase RhmA